MLINTVKKFAEWVRDEIKDYLPDTYCDADIKVCEVSKSNGVLLTGLTIKTRDAMIAPTIYMERYFEEYEKGKCMEQILEEISNARLNAEYSGAFDLSIDKWDDVKFMIVPRIVGKADWNVDCFVNRPYERFHDLCVNFVIDLDKFNGGSASIKVTNQLIEKWGVGEGPMICQAYTNSEDHELYSPVFKSMFQTMVEMRPDLEDMLEDDLGEEGMFVLTNERRTFGASLLLHDNVLGGIYERIGDFIIIPSSVHEVIIMPKSKAGSPEDLKDMISAVNATEIDKVDQLSDHPYIYTKDRGLRDYE